MSHLIKYNTKLETLLNKIEDKFYQLSKKIL